MSDKLKNYDIKEVKGGFPEPDQLYLIQVDYDYGYCIGYYEDSKFYDINDEVGEIKMENIKSLVRCEDVVMSVSYIESTASYPKG